MDKCVFLVLCIASFIFGTLKIILSQLDPNACNTIDLGLNLISRDFLLGLGIVDLIWFIIGGVHLLLVHWCFGVWNLCCSKPSDDKKLKLIYEKKCV